MLDDHPRPSRSSTSCSSSFAVRTDLGDSSTQPRQSCAPTFTSHSYNKTARPSPRQRSGSNRFDSQHLKNWGLVEGVVRPDEKKGVYHRVYKHVEQGQMKKFEKDLKEGKIWYRHPDYCEGYPCRGDIRYCQELQKWFYTRNCVKHHGLSAQYVCKPYHEGVKIDVKADRLNQEVNVFSNAVAPEDVHACRKIKVLESEIRREKQISARLLDEVERFKTDIEYMENKLRLSEETKRSVESDNVNLKIRLEKLQSELETEDRTRPEIGVGHAMVRLEGIERLLVELIDDDN